MDTYPARRNDPVTDSLLGAFLVQAPPETDATTDAKWIASLQPKAAGPTELITRIREALTTPAAGDLAGSIALGLAFCLTDALAAEPHTARPDRLPLSRARLEASARADSSVAEFLQHVLESWVLAQHSYWSVGRGLADARARGRILLRLKIILDEGGWAHTPGVSRGNPRQLRTGCKRRSRLRLSAVCSRNSLQRRCEAPASPRRSPQQRESLRGRWMRRK